MNFLQTLWYRRSLWHLLLWPASWLFGLAVGLRRLAWRRGWLRAEAVGVPVIVVGNIAVGGTGKTPLVIWLVERLREAGFHPGVVSRGYGGAGELRAVTTAADPAAVGDEPALLARRCGVPVWVGRDRVAAARALLAANPRCDVIVADDGLQHYRLRRDIEIVVADNERRHGNGLLLPAGPLREPVSRLAGVDAVVWHGGDGDGWRMRLGGATLVNLRRPELRRPAGDFTGPLHAIAGIGNPGRFFSALRGLGLEVIGHPFADHHAYTAADLAFAAGATLLMTEKDAVKCAAFAGEDWWVLPVDAEVTPGLAQHIIQLLRTRHGCQAA